MKDDSEKPLILFTTMNDLSAFGGIETQIPQEVKSFVSLGYRVHVVSRPPRGEIHVARAEGITHSHYNPALLDLPWLMKDVLVSLWISRLTRRMSKRARVVAISFGVMDGSGVAIAKLLGARVRLIQRVPGPISYEVVHFTPSKLRRYRFYAVFYSIVELFSYMVSEVVLPVSEFEETNVKSYSIDGGRVRILRCGIDGSRYGPGAGVCDLRVPSDNKVVMFVGRLYLKNGPMVLADSIPEILRNEPRTTFVFVGDGPLRGELETKLAPLIKEGVVIFTGFRKDIPELLSLADVYTSHVSSDMEGIGQTAMEALMSGVAVVVGRDRITEKLVHDGETGRLVTKDNPSELARAVVSLLHDDERRARIGAAGREFALERLSYDAMIEELRREVNSAGRRR